MTKKKPKNRHDGRLDVIAETFDATERTVTGQTTHDPSALQASGLEFREEAGLSKQTEFDEHFRIPNIIKRKDKK